jgi:hypothetical protein
MGFLYTSVTKAQSLQPSLFLTDYSNHPYARLEQYFIEHGIAADKKDLASGVRVYRMHSNFKRRLEVKKININQVMVEKMFIPTSVGEFFFIDTDPTIGLLAKHEVWLPVGA